MKVKAQNTQMEAYVEAVLPPSATAALRRLLWSVQTLGKSIAIMDYSVYKRNAIIVTRV